MRRLFASCAALLMACACAPEAEAPVRNQAEAGQAASREGPPPPAVGSVATNAAMSSPAKAAAGERRCGWLQNPTPGNWWLVDRDGEWILGEQGGYQAPGLDEMPDMTEGEWVETNGSYGYGCACLDVVTAPPSRRVVKIASAEPHLLAQCRADRRLPGPPPAPRP